MERMHGLLSTFWNRTLPPLISMTKTV